MITEATLRVRPLPAARRYEGWSFRSFARGRARRCAALEQADAAPDVARLSDEDETGCARAGSAAAPPSALGRALPAPARPRGRLPRDRRLRGRRRRRRARRRASARTLLRAAGGLPLGRARRARPGQRGRYAAPYLRDDLLDHGVLVETLETATTWSNLPRCTPRSRRAARGARARHAAARHVPRLAPVPLGRLALLHVPRRARSGDRARAVAGGQDGRVRRDRRAAAARSPTTTRSAATTRPGMAAEVGDAGIDAAARGQGAARPGRDHEPREAAAARVTSGRRCSVNQSVAAPAARSNWSV